MKTNRRTNETPDALLQVRNLSVSYGRHSAINDVNLDIPRNALTAIVGPSGCGKSTFLSTLNRLSDLVPECHVSGSVTLDEIDVLSPKCDVLALRRRVGMVFQAANPFPLSVRRNLTLPLLEHGASKDEVDVIAKQALIDVGLWDELGDRIDASALKLSGGQQQRLCIARALVLKPEMILFDEPCSALDPVASGVVEDLIVTLREKVTVVIVTHNLAQARRIADHVAVFWMRNGAGTVIETGRGGQVFEAPRDPDAADYLSGARG